MKLKTERKGQDSAEFIDFRKQLLPHSKQNKIENFPDNNIILS